MMYIMVYMSTNIPKLLFQVCTVQQKLWIGAVLCIEPLLKFRTLKRYCREKTTVPLSHFVLCKYFIFIFYVDLKDCYLFLFFIFALSQQKSVQLNTYPFQYFKDISPWQIFIQLCKNVTFKNHYFVAFLLSICFENTLKCFCISFIIQFFGCCFCSVYIKVLISRITSVDQFFGPSPEQTSFKLEL